MYYFRLLKNGKNLGSKFRFSGFKFDNFRLQVCYNGQGMIFRVCGLFVWEMWNGLQTL